MVFKDRRQGAGEQEQVATDAEERIPSTGNWQLLLNQISTDVFLGSLILYVAMLIIEVLRRQAASYFINIGIIFWIVVASGTIAILSADGNDPLGVEGYSADKERPRLVLATLTGLLSFTVVLLAVWRLGSVSLLLSLGLGLLLILIAPSFT